MNQVNDFQARLASQIVNYIRTKGLPAGSHLPEQVLSRHFHVSRTPIRAALVLLTDQGVIEHHRNRGYFTRWDASRVDPSKLPASDEEKVYLRIAGDRMSRRLPDQVSEADLLRRYGAARSVLSRALQRLVREGLVEKRPGRGWAFAPVVDSEESHDESYRFRLSIEPAALLEPGFCLDRERASRSRAAHEDLLAGTSRQVSAIDLFEMNAEFHELLAASSGNRFFLQAVRQQNRLRRFANYRWVHGPTRPLEASREHLAILDAIEGGDMFWAATLLRRHLQISGSLTPYQQSEASAEPVEPSLLIPLG